MELCTGYSAIIMANLLDDAPTVSGSVVTIEIDKTVARLTSEKKYGRRRSSAQSRHYGW